jgi:murein DD-endopeptidase MepM/ murein hydrolase activator NlpD
MRRSIRAIAAALAVALLLPAVTQAAWPVATRQAYVSQKFKTGHKANDIVAPAGTKVVPMRSGRVVFEGRKGNCGGIQVWVRHGDGLYSAYYHLRSESVRKGERVRQSRTRLGRVGSSGCAVGAHLHVEVWRGFPWKSGSHRIDPWPFLNSGEYLPSRYR